MRDANVLALNAHTAQNVAALYKQIVRMDARQQAFERVLSGRWAFLGAILNPRWFWASVEAVHQSLMKSHDEQVRKAAEEIKAEARKPKLTMVH